MQEVCLNHELASVIGIRRLLERIKYTHSFIREEKVYGDIVGNRILPSTTYTYTRIRERRTTTNPLYRTREYDTEESTRPNTLPTITRYERVYEMKENYGMVIVTISLFQNRETASLCIQNPVLRGIDRVLLSLLGLMNGWESNDIPTIVSRMRSILPSVRMPSYHMLTWKDISFRLFASSTLVSVPKGDKVLYILSEYGTFLYDGYSITPIDTTTSSLTVISGVWDGRFHAVDILVSSNTPVLGYTYAERLGMISRYHPLPIFIHPKDTNDIYTFFSSHDHVLIIGRERYEWDAITLQRVYIGEGGTPMGIDGDLVPINMVVKNPLPYVGKVVEVVDGNIRAISIHDFPMTIDEIEILLLHSKNAISQDDISGRNCTLYNRSIERMIGLLYDFYQSRGVTTILEISKDIDHAYWRTDGITTYALVSKEDQNHFIDSSSGLLDDNVFLGGDYEVIFEEPDYVQATNIFRTIPEDIEDYISLASDYVTTILDDEGYQRVYPILRDAGLDIESTIALNHGDLLPVNKECVLPLTLYVWKWRTSVPETIRQIYTPLAPGTRQEIETPYGNLTRIGTLGTGIGRDESLPHAILESTSPDYRKLDRIGRTLYAIKHRYPNINYPIYLIPQSSWSMYQYTNSGIYRYGPNTGRTPGIVLILNSNHWEPLARARVNGSLQYIW